MRRVINPQLQFGEQDISAIELDLKSRDDIPQILRGLQYIYVTPEIRERVFAILADVMPAAFDEHGKPRAESPLGALFATDRAACMGQHASADLAADIDAALARLSGSAGAGWRTAAGSLPHGVVTKLLPPTRFARGCRSKQYSQRWRRVAEVGPWRRCMVRPTVSPICMHV